MADLQRKLAAIMFTDIAGYTATMEQDEIFAIGLLSRKRSLLKPLVNKHSGNWVKEMGDGTLSTFFDSAKAVKCAQEFQQKMQENKDFNVRVGIHSGDVIFEENDVFGDAVNVASRLEGIAAPGGICVSSEVMRHADFKQKPIYQSLGLQSLKGLGRLVEVYALRGNSKILFPVPKKKSEIAKHNIKKSVPSVAMTMLENLGDAKDEFYAFGITSDLVTDLAKAGRIRVAPMKDIKPMQGKDYSDKEMAIKLRVRYIVHGSLWKHGDKFHLSMEMVDAEHDKHFWGDSWQENWDDLPKIKGNIADSILKILDSNIDGVKNITAAVTDKTQAYEFYLRAKHIHAKRKSIEDVETARGLLKQAIKQAAGLVCAKNELGITYIHTGDYDKALEILKKSLKTSKEQKNQSDEAAALHLLGSVHYYQGDYDDALKFFDESLVIRHEIDDCAGEGRTLGNIGNVHGNQGDYDNALKFYKQVLEIYRKIDDRIVEGRTLGNIGLVHDSRGDYDNALKYFKDSLAVCREVGKRNGEGHALSNIGNVYKKRGDYDKAKKLYEKSLKIQREIGNRVGEGNALGNIGLLHKNLGEYNKALKFYKENLIIRRKIGDRTGEAIVLGNFGSLYQKTEKFNKSAKHFEQSLEICAEINMKKIMPCMRSGLALALTKTSEDKTEQQEIISLVESVEKDLPNIKDDMKTITLWNLSQVYGEIENLKLKIENFSRRECKEKRLIFLKEAYNNIMECVGKIRDEKSKQVFFGTNSEIIEIYERED